MIINPPEIVTGFFTYAIKKDGISKMKNEKNKTAIKNLLGENDTVRVKRTSVSPKTRKIFDSS